MCRSLGYCKFKKAKAPQLSQELKQFPQDKLIDLLMFYMKVSPDTLELEIENSALDEGKSEDVQMSVDHDRQPELPSQIRLTGRYLSILRKDQDFCPRALMRTRTTVVGDAERRFDELRMAEILDCFHYAQRPLCGSSKFVDIGCGIGGFLLSALMRTECTHVVGIEYRKDLKDKADQCLAEFDAASRASCESKRIAPRHEVVLEDAINQLLELRDATHILFFLGPCPGSRRLARIIASNLTWLREVAPKIIIATHKLWEFNDELLSVTLPYAAPSLCDVPDTNGCPNTLHVCSVDSSTIVKPHLVEIAQSLGRGLGLFATIDLKPKQAVIDIEFDRLTSRDLAAMDEDERHYTSRYMMQISEPDDAEDGQVTYILPLNAARFVNGDPNNYNVIIVEKNDRWILRVIGKGIRKGQELLLNYDHTKQHKPIRHARFNTK